MVKTNFVKGNFVFEDDVTFQGTVVGDNGGAFTDTGSEISANTASANRDFRFGGALNSNNKKLAFDFGKCSFLGGDVNASNIGDNIFAFGSSSIKSKSGYYPNSNSVILGFGAGKHYTYGRGSFIMGYASGTGKIQVGYTYGYRNGSLAGGLCTNSTIYAKKSGCLAFGYAQPNSGGLEASGFGSTALGASGINGGIIKSTSSGAFAQGSTSPYSGDIIAQGAGAFAQGSTSYQGTGYIKASGDGAFAQGVIPGFTSYNILASGDGAFAQGYANTASIIASATSAVQLGPGTNNVANSLQVGSTMWVRPNTLWMKEKASEADATATWGKLWVKNTTPCELWFTDDAGTSTKIV